MRSRRRGRRSTFGTTCSSVGTHAWIYRLAVAVRRSSATLKRRKPGGGGGGGEGFGEGLGGDWISASSMITMRSSAAGDGKGDGKGVGVQQCSTSQTPLGHLCTWLNWACACCPAGHSLHSRQPDAQHSLRQPDAQHSLRQHSSASHTPEQP